MNDWILILYMFGTGYSTSYAVTSQPGFTRESCIAAVESWKKVRPKVNGGYCIPRTVKTGNEGK